MDSGRIILNPIRHVVQTMFRNPVIYHNLHYSYVHNETLGAFWTAEQWKISEDIIGSLAPAAKFFPLLIYSDKAEILKSRAGHKLHPIVVVPAGVPRDIWKQPAYKYTIGYISVNVSLEQALKFIGMRNFVFC